MAVSRVSTLSLFNKTQGDLNSVMTKMANLQGQISSGFKSDNFKGLNGQVEQFTLLEAKLRKIEQFKQNNAVSEARLQTADQAAEQLIAYADKMEDLLVLRRSAAGNSGELNFKQQMDDLMSGFIQNLNTQFEGRYIFGGIDTANPPVSEPLPAPQELGELENGYYEGASQDITYRIDERVENTFPVRADDPAMQRIIAAYHLAISADATNADDELGRALDMLQAGQNDLVTARTRVNASIINIDQTNDRLEQMRLYLKGVTEQVAKTDIVSATSEVANHEAVLQASFQVYARLSQLRLSDFL